MTHLCFGFFFLFFCSVLFFVLFFVFCLSVCLWSFCLFVCLLVGLFDIFFFFFFFFLSLAFLVILTKNWNVWKHVSPVNPWCTILKSVILPSIGIIYHHGKSPSFQFSLSAASVSQSTAELLRIHWVIHTRITQPKSAQYCSNSSFQYVHMYILHLDNGRVTCCKRMKLLVTKSSPWSAYICLAL